MGTVKPESGLKTRQEKKDNAGTSSAICGYLSLQISGGMSTDES